MSILKKKNIFSSIHFIYRHNINPQVLWSVLRLHSSNTGIVKVKHWLCKILDFKALQKRLYGHRLKDTNATNVGRKLIEIIMVQNTLIT